MSAEYSGCADGSRAYLTGKDQENAMDDFRKSTVYQIYVKSFCDSNGDGIGDLNGITKKLPYLKSLGVDYIWTTPFFVSPLNDNGYDVADYRAVDPLFGTMEDCEKMIAEADRLGMGFMFDMVFNHTSTHHEWFQKALNGDPKYMNYYIFRDGSDEGAPTNWVSKFGGSAWEYVPSLGKYYLHLFDVSQADLNWDNPEVRAELADIIRFWKGKGIKGFRFDVVNLISKPAVFENDYEGDGRRFYTDGPHVHEYLKGLAAEGGLDAYITVGEMSSTSLANCIRYTNPKEHELAMVFSFHHLKVDYKNGDKWALKAPDFDELRSLYKTWQEGMQEADGWNALFLNNHDQPRAISRFTNDTTYHKESAKVLAGLIHLMRGTPYIYQGEEIGITNAGFKDIDSYRDVESLNYYRILREAGKTEAEALEIIGERSRDNGRTPMQWDGTENAGFTTGTPWLGIPGNHKTINVENEEQDPDSILAFYRKLVALRKEEPVISDGRIDFEVEVPYGVIAYTRSYEETQLFVWANLTGDEKTVRIPESGKLFLSNYGMEGDIPAGEVLLKPYELLVIKK